MDLKTSIGDIEANISVAIDLQVTALHALTIEFREQAATDTLAYSIVALDRAEVLLHEARNAAIAARGKLIEEENSAARTQ